MYLYKLDLGLNNQEWLICRKTQTKNKHTNKQVLSLCFSVSLEAMAMIGYSTLLEFENCSLITRCNLLSYCISEMRCSGHPISEMQFTYSKPCRHGVILYFL